MKLLLNFIVGLCVIVSGISLGMYFYTDDLLWILSMFIWFFGVVFGYDIKERNNL